MRRVHLFHNKTENDVGLLKDLQGTQMRTFSELNLGDGRRSLVLLLFNEQQDNWGEEFLCEMLTAQSFP